MGMSQGYLHAVREVFPQLAIGHDAYHVLALPNKAVDDTRRDLYRDLQAEERKVIKGSRLLLLRGGERLGALMALNEPLYTAYLLKEQWRMFWTMGDEETAQAVLTNWLAEAGASGLAHFLRLAQTIEEHLSGLLEYFRHPISTSPVGGVDQQDQSAQTPSLRLPGHGLLQAAPLLHPRGHPGISRMNHKTEADADHARTLEGNRSGARWDPRGPFRPKTCGCTSEPALISFQTSTISGRRSHGTHGDQPGPDGEALAGSAGKG
jgi:hypothetical protein